MRVHGTTRRKTVRIAAAATTAVAVAWTATGVAQAHMGIELRGGTPTAGSSSTIMFRPGHGCDGDATNALTVTIPEGIAVGSAKAQPKAGWTLSRDGSTITWSGGELPDDQFDEFGLRVTWPKLPDGVTSQRVYFKAVQTCDAEITVRRSGSAATITGHLPAAYAGKEVALFVDDVPLTIHPVGVDADGTFTVRTRAGKVPVGAEVTARTGDRTVGNSVASTEAWVEIPVDGSTASLASPAPYVTVVAGSGGGH